MVASIPCQKSTADDVCIVGHYDLAIMVRFSLETGLRRANVTGFKWNQVDLVRRCAWIQADQAKARKPIAVPLSDAAVLLLREQVGSR